MHSIYSQSQDGNHKSSLLKLVRDCHTTGFLDAPTSCSRPCSANWASSPHQFPSWQLLPSCQRAWHRRPLAAIPRINCRCDGPPQPSEVLISHRAAQTVRTLTHSGLPHCGTHIESTPFYTTHVNTFFLYHKYHIHKSTHGQVYIHILVRCSTPTCTHTLKSHCTSDSQICLHIGLTCKL